MSFEQNNSSIQLFGSSMQAFLEEVEKLQKENRALRRSLCLARCPYAYMDDGEAQDNSEHPSIDYLRDSLDLINLKLRERYQRVHGDVNPVEAISNNVLALVPEDIYTNPKEDNLDK